MTGVPHRLSRGIASLAAIVLFFVAVPVGLVAAARSRFGTANPLAATDPPWRWDVDQLGDAVSQPLRDDAVANLLIRSSLAITWLALAMIAVTIVTEVVHMVRHQGLAAPHVRGVGWAQRIGRWVAVGLIALLPINSFASGANAVGDAGPAATAQRLGIVTGEAATVPLGGTGPVSFGSDGFGVLASTHPTAPDGSERLPRPEASTNASIPTTAATVHVVERGESIYAIAAEYAVGDETRTIEIADQILDLNLEKVMDNGQRFTNPALIQPGWTLALPSGVGTPRAPEVVIDVPDAPGLDVSDDDPTPVRGIPRIELDTAVEDDHTTYVVVQGDTLSEIAAQHLGEQHDWPKIWEENRGDEMGGGRIFDDPDLILPGWELDISSTGPDSASHDETGAESPAPAPSPIGPAPDIYDIRDGNRPAATTDPTASATADSTEAVRAPASTVPAVLGGDDAGGDIGPGDAEPRAPAPIRLEHAALFAAGVLTLVGIRRQRALRSALPHARVPNPPPEVAAIERRMRSIDPGERSARIDVAVRAAAHRLAGSGVQIGSVRSAKDGQLTLRLTADAPLDPPWIGDGATWTLPASVPIELLSDGARQVGQPCLALVTLGIDTDDRDVLVDLEAAGTTTVVAGADQADEIVRAIGSGLATSLASEVVHLMVASLGVDFLFDHPNARRLPSVDAVMHAATSLAGSTVGHERSSFDLRARRTGGEMWEPAVALFGTTDRAIGTIDAPAASHGIAVVAACAPHAAAETPATAGARLISHADRWVLEAFGEEIELAPIGVTTADVAEIGAILADASQPIAAERPVVLVDLDDASTEPFRPLPHDIVVGLMGSVTIHSAAGVAGQFERSKTVELIAWLATHRDRATRTAARTALWEMDVRDATFANVVSEARRSLGRLIEPPPGEEWLARTLNESLPLHARVVTDADLIAERVEHARLAPPAHAIDVLQPAVETIRGLPFAGTSYLWPDADGITSRLVLLATTASAELAGHALSIGDTDLVFWSTGQGLKVLPGHEELIGLRMRAHARAGDLAGVRQEWESYERVIMADSWSDGEPAPKLLDLRHQLLTSG